MDFGFLIDQSCPGIAASLRHGAIVRLADVGLPDSASDENIFDVAQDRELIIVTNNPADFQHIMRNAVHRAGKNRCGDGWGMLVPNSLKAFNFDDVTRRLSFNGKRIDWNDVTILNLQVSLGRDRAPLVTPLLRCTTCIAQHTRACDRCRELSLLDFKWPVPQAAEHRKNN